VSGLGLVCLIYKLIYTPPKLPRGVAPLPTTFNQWSRREFNYLKSNLAYNYRRETRPLVMLDILEAMYSTGVNETYPVNIMTCAGRQRFRWLQQCTFGSPEIRDQAEYRLRRIITCHGIRANQSDFINSQDAKVISAPGPGAQAAVWSSEDYRFLTVVFALKTSL